MKELIQAISEVNASGMDAVMKAVLKRYGELFPNWEVSLFTLEKTADRNEQIDQTIAVLQKMKTPG